MSLLYSILHLVNGSWFAGSMFHDISNGFQHQMHADKFIGSLCRACGSVIGFSPSHRVIGLLEKVHRCREGKSDNQ